MIALVSMLCIIGIFLAGHYFAANTVAAMVMLGLFVICLGVLIAAAETRGFEGVSAPDYHDGYNWDKLMVAVQRWALSKDRMLGNESVYVQTPAGPLPVRGVFFARINQGMSIVLDTTEAGDAADLEYNRIKQGVM